jgi:hypothetical protein
LNAITPAFVLYGAASCGTNLAANGLVYLSAGPSGAWTYAVALAFAEQFGFGSLLPAGTTFDGGRGAVAA